jgi:hypothetical protein
VENEAICLLPFESDAGVVERSRCKSHRFSIQVLRPILNKLTTHNCSLTSYTTEERLPHLAPRISQRARADISAVVPALKHRNDLVEENGALGGASAVDFHLDIMTRICRRATRDQCARLRCEIIREKGLLRAAIWSW